MALGGIRRTGVEPQPVSRRHAWCTPASMEPLARHLRWIVPVLVITFPTRPAATPSDPVEHVITQFLAHDGTQHAYRAVRHLEAENGNRSGWLEAVTDYSPAEGLRYRITAEGGSPYIRSKVLKAVLDGEREMIAHGNETRSALALSNYQFEPHGIDSEGLANVLVSPRREEPALVRGTMFLKPTDGGLVRLQGRLAKSPSFWLSDVNIVRMYTRLRGVVMPVALESSADVRLMGRATMRMTYVYSEIDGHAVASPLTTAPDTVVSPF